MGTKAKRALSPAVDAGNERSSSPSGDTSRSNKKARVAASKKKAGAGSGKPKSLLAVAPIHEVVSENSAEDADVSVQEDVSEASEDTCEAGKTEVKRRGLKPPTKRATSPVSEGASPARKERVTVTCRFVGKPISKAEAVRRWPHRYSKKANAQAVSNGDVPIKKKAANDDVNEVECIAHYSRAEVDHQFFELGDCVDVNSDGAADYLGKILELYELADHSKWLRVMWFFRSEDTALGDGLEHDNKRVFCSEEVDDNLLECVVEKKKVVRVQPPARFKSKTNIPRCDFYYDMGYRPAYSTFYELPPEDVAGDSSEELSTVENCEESVSARVAVKPSPQRKGKVTGNEKKSELNPEICLLDLYSGCGAMSTGLCMGARLGGANVVSKWAVDLNEHACTSLKHNHPETEVRHESAEDFLMLIKEWQKLCKKYPVDVAANTGSEKNESDSDDDEDLGEDVFEVEKIISIRWRGISKLELKLDKGKSPSYVQKESKSSAGIEYKVRWKGYGEDDDTWEPASNLEDSPGRVSEFVIAGRRNKLLPLPGDCDIICGGPPCQGASGFNRFRNKLEPLQCVRNRQIIVYMDIVEFLKPRFVLMENVVDILKFADGLLGRYALSRLVKMHYQAKLGLLVAGCYGLPQFRMRVFLWGATPGEKLPPFPLPTHTVVMRGHAPQSWERNVVAYDELDKPKLEAALLLSDAISDLPKIANSDKKDEMSYDKSPESKFQNLIRLPKYVHDRKIKPAGKNLKALLYDHRSLELNTDDFQRTCKIPRKKGSNFRDLDGIIILPDGTVDVERKNRRLLPSGKPLVPDYAISFVHGKSLKPFGRLWWDETVSTVVTRAEPHNQSILHPNQDRVLSIRENARLQGFPDFYKLFGPVKERYIQVGNAVAVPVARALGYCLGQSLKSHLKDGSGGNPVLFQLPKNFPTCLLKPVDNASDESSE